MTKSKEFQEQHSHNYTRAEGDCPTLTENLYAKYYGENHPNPDYRPNTQNDSGNESNPHQKPFTNNYDTLQTNMITADCELTPSKMLKTQTKN
ncbi:hypothetical protein J6590_049560 [Homalodisca vitripennis]|nr:hypothetical protein J6590_049560 [Homalodisca vitripennis]